MDGGFVGVMTADLHLPEANSLKDKRKPLHSLKAALVKATSCSVSEVANHDVLRRARISLTLVAPDAAHAERLLNAAERVVFSGPFEVLAIDRALRSLDELLTDSPEGVGHPDT